MNGRESRLPPRERLMEAQRAWAKNSDHDDDYYDDEQRHRDKYHRLANNVHVHPQQTAAFSSAVAALIWVLPSNISLTPRWSTVASTAFTPASMSVAAAA